MDLKNMRPKKLREKSIDELKKTIKELESELMNLRVSKVSSGVAAKLIKIRVVKRTIAKHLTIINEMNREKYRLAFSTRNEIKKYNEENKTKYSLKRRPLELRNKLTRALRRKLTKKQLNAKTLKQRKRDENFPQRKFIVKQ